MPRRASRAASQGHRSKRPRRRTHRGVRSQLRREHFESIGPPVPVAASAIPRVGLQGIEFIVTWSGATAALDHLTYNAVLVQEEPEYDTPNRITLEFERPLEDAHLFEWTLLFPGKTLTNLRATVRLDGGDPVEIASAPSLVDRWKTSAHTP